MPKRKKKEAEDIGFITTLSVPAVGSVGMTGSWRIFLPVIDGERCNKCLLCWIYCPEACISKDIRIDYDYCKGCGICAEECPRGAIAMVKEEKRS
ncbi:MAG: 4Fe-4S binding protein [Actinobacteria bacterium]|nr:4Fe-4S binding protein [Actinomycetota bacterium]MDI6831965.1 4Fe-4S binding protein [Actinomycetota bacterium]